LTSLLNNFSSTSTPTATVPVTTLASSSRETFYNNIFLSSISPLSTLPSSSASFSPGAATSSYPAISLPLSNIGVNTGVSSSSSSSATQSSRPGLSTASTVYTTSVYTVTGCALEVTNYPVRIGLVTTETIALYISLPCRRGW
jgi:chitinase